MKFSIEKKMENENENEVQSWKKIQRKKESKRDTMKSMEALEAFGKVEG